MKYQIGLDTGGTFTDCVVVDQAGMVIESKSFTTPDDLSIGVLKALEEAAKQLGLSLEQMLADTRRLIYGSTIGVNTLIQRQGASTGLITTRGFEDTILIMRAVGRADGLSEDEMLFMTRPQKPEPIVPRYLIEGVTERIDCQGEVVIPLHVEEVRAAAERLIAGGVISIAVCFLWSFVNPTHEQRVKEILNQFYPDLSVSISSEVSPVLGEYERTVTTVINSYLIHAILKHIHNLQNSLKARGLRSPLLIMQCSGGCVTLQEELNNAHSGGGITLQEELKNAH
jgi:N-methylhydantoinase A